MSIKVSHISKQYGAQMALDDVSLSIQKGEITGFLGPNGAGKSTLMKILTGYVAPTSGTAVVNGFSIKGEIKKVKACLGYLPENNPLYPEMYIREYLDFCASLRHIAKSRIEEVIKTTGLAPEMGKKIGALSKGYRQRVGLAAALLHDPEVIILDEPTTGLDPNQLLDIRSLIISLGKHKTVLLSTHIMQEVEAICDRVVIINKGRIIADKKLNDLKGGRAQEIIVEFDYRVEDVALSKISGVQHVANPSGFVYELRFDTERDMRPEVFDFAHDNGLKILQLTKKNTSLEALFQELTGNK